MAVQSACAPAGSSPLTRGKRVGGVERGGNMGLIPAHAGKTVEPGRRIRQLGAHPRSRGENAAAGAVAGRRGAHPRSRGENSFLVNATTYIKGSSPLTRGKRGLAPDARACRRLIPAHAGKTPRRAWSWGRTRAHPRSRGENSFLVNATTYIKGSSPLTRGKRGLAPDARACRRLIPAHAGKTPRRAWSWGRTRAHPRSRGENCRSARRVPSARGSSPLTRGKPARLSSGPHHSPAHPRSRGENRIRVTVTDSGPGSSPLTRGKQGGKL